MTGSRWPGDLPRFRAGGLPEHHPRPHPHRCGDDRSDPASRACPRRPHIDYAGRIRAEVGLPTFHAARIPDVATARHAVASGRLDMVGMTRAHMADPHIVRKIIEGKEDTIRPCVGATYCLDRIYQGGIALCIHNPSTGREETQPHQIAPAPVRKKVVIVGAGPAGLEAARVAAERGHEVVVLGGGGRARWASVSDRAKPAAAGNDRDHRLAHGTMRGTWGGIPLQHLRGSG